MLTALGLGTFYFECKGLVFPLPVPQSAQPSNSDLFAVGVLPRDVSRWCCPAPPHPEVPSPGAWDEDSRPCPHAEGNGAWSDTASSGSGRGHLTLWRVWLAPCLTPLVAWPAHDLTWPWSTALLQWSCSIKPVCSMKCAHPHANFNSALLETAWEDTSRDVSGVQKIVPRESTSSCLMSSRQHFLCSLSKSSSSQGIKNKTYHGTLLRKFNQKLSKHVCVRDQSVNIIVYRSLAAVTMPHLRGFWKIA